MTTGEMRDRHGLVILSEEECYQRLSKNHIGRLAISAIDSPEIYPVNYTMDARDIVFKSTIGRKWVEAIWNRPVAFEIDHYDIGTHTGWSVMVIGEALAVADSDDVERLEHLPVRPWASAEATQWVRIRPKRLSGRVIPYEDRSL